jgi:branched-chain amino acid transport system substrate-binding protein
VKSRIRVTRAVVALVAVACVASVCGSSSKAFAGSAKGSPIKIGFELGLTGTEASLFSVAKPVIASWASYVNANGGIAGHQVDPVIVDSQSQPAAALVAAKSLVQKGVVAVMVGDAATETITAPYFSSQNIADLGVSYVAQDQTLKNVYTSFTSAEVEYPGTVAVGKAAGYTKMAAIGCLESPACAAAEAVYKADAPSIGVTYEGTSDVSFSQPSYTAECLQEIGTGAKFLELDLAPSTQKTVATTCVQQGFKGAFGAPESAADILFLKTIPNTKWIGVLNGFPWWVNSPPVNTFRAAMKKYAPTADYQTPTATAYWAALQLFRSALSKSTGSVTATSVIQALGTVKKQTLGGLLAQPVSFAAGQMGNTVSCYWGYEYTAGKAHPTLLPTLGKSGNGPGPLASTCYPPKS